GMDVFPSLHTALTLYITAFLWRDGKRKTALLLAPVTAGTIAATIWLRYHYGVDDLAGLALALAALYGSREKTG
ncbi:MAG: phosphatase PAP2 family protein, partial [Cardiobacterium sp.]